MSFLQTRYGRPMVPEVSIDTVTLVIYLLIDISLQQCNYVTTYLLACCVDLCVQR
jgi:hypothetical protein